MGADSLLKGRQPVKTALLGQLLWRDLLRALRAHQENMQAKPSIVWFVLLERLRRLIQKSVAPTVMRGVLPVQIAPIAHSAMPESMRQRLVVLLAKREDSLKRELQYAVSVTVGEWQLREVASAKLATSADTALWLDSPRLTPALDVLVDIQRPEAQWRAPSAARANMPQQGVNLARSVRQERFLLRTLVSATCVQLARKQRLPRPNANPAQQESIQMLHKELDRVQIALRARIRELKAGTAAPLAQKAGLLWEDVIHATSACLESSLRLRLPPALTVMLGSMRLRNRRHAPTVEQGLSLPRRLRNAQIVMLGRWQQRGPHLAILAKQENSLMLLKAMRCVQYAKQELVQVL